MTAPAGSWADFWLTFCMLIAAAWTAIALRSSAAFLAATTTFVAGSLLIEALSRLYRRMESHIDEPDQLLRMLVGPWLGLMLVATVLLSLPLATQSGVPDYRHNFWLHVLNNAHAAASAACLVGTTVYGFGQEYTLFGQAVLIAVTQLAGMGLATVGLAIFRPFLNNTLRLRTVLRLAVILQLVAVAAMWHSWHDEDVRSTWERLWWGVVHASSALWNSGLTLRPDGLAPYLMNGAVFTTVTTLSIAGSLSLPVILDLVLGIRRSSPATPAPPWRRLPAWEAGGAFTLLFVGAALLFIFEMPWAPHVTWRLPDSWIPSRPLHFGDEQVAMRDEMSPAMRWTTAVFVSATLRSAGLQSMSVMQGAISWPSYGLILLWMFIGGSAGGVAGGLRTTCLLLIGICVLSRSRAWASPAGGAEARRVLLRSVLVFTPLWLLVNAACVAALAAATEATRYEVLFEGVAACNSVGLSTGLSLHLSWIGRMILILVMLAGRALPVVFWLGLSRKLTRCLSRQETAGLVNT